MHPVFDQSDQATYCPEQLRNLQIFYPITWRNLKIQSQTKQIAVHPSVELQIGGSFNHICLNHG